MPPLGEAAKQFNMDARLHSFQYATASKVGLKRVLYIGLGVHKLK